MIAFSISSEGVKRIQVWKPRNKDKGFFAASQILMFSKTCIFAQFYLIFQDKLLLCFSRSPALEDDIKF